MKVALVDDEEDLLTELAESVAKMGHEPVLIGDPRQAIGIIASDHAIRLALIDLLMPGMPGTEVIAGLRPLFALPRRLRVIGMTGHGSINDICRLTESGAVAVLLKPFLADEVIRKVSEAVSEILEPNTRAEERRENRPPGSEP